MRPLKNWFVRLGLFVQNSNMKQHLFTRMAALWVLCLVFIFSGEARGQNTWPQGYVVPGHRLCMLSNQLPETLLNGRTAVLIDTPATQDSLPLRPAWRELAEVTHEALFPLSIDAVAYYHLGDLKASTAAAREYAALLGQRLIKNLVVVSQYAKGYALLVTTFNGQPTLMDHGQPATLLTGSSLPDVLEQLRQKVNVSGLEVSNFLMIDRPEIFNNAKLVTKKALPSYSVNISSVVLAVPVPNPPKMPANLDRNQNPEAYQYWTGLAAQQRADSLALAQTLQQYYPFEFKLVPDTIPEDNLRRLGYQLILRRVKGTAQGVRQLLSYPPDAQDSTVYNSVQALSGGVAKRAMPANAVVYKYYMKRLYSGDIYLGRCWEAAPEWQIALRNHCLLIDRK